MKKLLSTLLTIMLLVLITGTKYVNASTLQAVTPAPAVQSEIELLEDGCYLETIIEDEPSINPGYSTFATTKYITKTKTAQYKNASGNVMWSVSIKATFSYDGSTSKCTSCSHSTTAPGQTWSIKSSSSSKYGSAAAATATAVHKNPVNGLSNSYTKTVTIKCSPTGVVS